MRCVVSYLIDGPLNELAYGVPLEGPYQTSLPSPDDTISYIREDREGQVTRILHKEEIKVQDYQILTREIVSTLKPLEEISLKMSVWGFYGTEGLYERIHDNQDRDLVLRRKKKKSLDYNNSFLDEYECSSLALDREERRDEKEEIGSLETRSNN
ncbi:hypothetical protein Tco_0959309, partial [Tanacetum coccineum]